PATANLVWEAVAGRFPEIVEGPERDGRFVVALALRPDGSVVAGGMRHVEARANQEFSAAQRELADLLPTDGRGIQGLALMPSPKGTVVAGNRVLKGDVLLNVRMVPANWDATRDEGIVRRVVQEKYADLFRPMRGDYINQVTI